jgi:hypothetical protein
MDEEPGPEGEHAKGQTVIDRETEEVLEQEHFDWVE